MPELSILDPIACHELDLVTITTRGKTVGVLVPALADIYGFICGSVILLEGIDLAESVLTEPFVRNALP